MNINHDIEIEMEIILSRLQDFDTGTNHDGECIGKVLDRQGEKE